MCDTLGLMPQDKMDKKRKEGKAFLEILLVKQPKGQTVVGWSFNIPVNS